MSLTARSENEPTLLVAEVRPSLSGVASVPRWPADRRLTERLAAAVSCGAVDISVEVDEGRVVGRFVATSDAVAAAVKARRAGRASGDRPLGEGGGAQR